MEIKNIVKQLKEGKLNRGIDEKYAGGFWDLAGVLADNYDITRQEAIYYALYQVAESCLEKDFD